MQLDKKKKVKIQFLFSAHDISSLPEWLVLSKFLFVFVVMCGE